MKYLILVSHGQFAYGLHDALEMFSTEGDETLISCCLEKGMDVDAYADRLRKKLGKIDREKDRAVLLGDLQGGSPLTYAMNILDEMGMAEQTPAYAGMNLPLALNVLLGKDMVTPEEADAAFMEGAQVRRFTLKDEEDEDDI